MQAELVVRLFDKILGVDADGLVFEGCAVGTLDVKSSGAVAGEQVAAFV